MHKKRLITLLGLTVVLLSSKTRSEGLAIYNWAEYLKDSSRRIKH